MTNFLEKRSGVYSAIGLGIAILLLAWIPDMPAVAAAFLFTLGCLIMLGFPMYAFATRNTIVPLYKLSRDELRERVFAHTAAMREHEAAYRQLDSVAQADAWSAMTAASGDDRDRIRREHDRANAVRRAEFDRVWKTRLHGSSVALRDELHERLRLKTNADGVHLTALDSGMLAGVNPIQESADYLDRLAQRLPE